MAPAPLCKTAIIKFLVDKETVPKLWNLSSNMRKRMKMAMEQMEIRLREYNENILKLKDWVKVGKKHKYAEEIEEMKKGISNYLIDIQEEADRVVYLNGKLRCFDIKFHPETTLQVDSITDLRINSWNNDFYSKCSFNKVNRLELKELPSSQVKDILLRVKQVKRLKIDDCSLSELNISALRIKSVEFENVIFEGEVKSPSYLFFLKFLSCKNLHLINCSRVSIIKIWRNDPKDSLDWLKKLKGVIEANINCRFSEYTNNLPNSLRTIASYPDFDSEKIDSEKTKKKFPFLVKICKKIPIEAAQALNLKSIYPEMSETEEKFTFRPREIIVENENVDQLNKHPELFEKIEKMFVATNRFNFDCLASQMKEIHFANFWIEGEQLESLVKNSWKFEESVVDLVNTQDGCARKLLKSLGKARKIKMNSFTKINLEDFPQFRFIS